MFLPALANQRQQKASRPTSYKRRNLYGKEHP